MIKTLLILLLALTLPGCGAVHEGMWTLACSSPLNAERRAGVSLDDCVRRNSTIHAAIIQQTVREVVDEFGVRYYYCGPTLCQRQSRRVGILP